ncbi:hypothetical protein Poli38472_012126 [Pythium oligandrum]|uniref:Dynamin-type G domain-containing protein n=1 Tax=Pythium oligandrum TaxID=41045 RepID=A0A8K1CQS0_PYTOL|nr:hypothetical protein Poli38472_012126 [Pythium oligandrum]|eukprot:TMW67010.1 hypothetical protein Poli38472_012126 [Pythium oligandrum]
MKKEGLLSSVQAHRGRHLVDNLRAIGLGKYIELPQIAVMGDTSSGKSSLLSALSGVSFPSSDQLTTRCPTQLILSHSNAFKGKVRLHRFHANHSEHDEELESMNDVPFAIAKLTQLLVDEGQYISDDQIVIELCGPDLPNLTLTDLPGLVRTVGDHEDRSIIGRVRDMVNRFMKQERTIIIAVVPANVDMHNTEILQAATEADPDGTRTIAVVTKVDLVDAGAERAVHDLLQNKKKHMRLGYHAVKCRNQKDLNDGMSIEQGLMQEQRFFREHEYWRHLKDHARGIKPLCERLVGILQDNIRRTLPSVIQEINSQVAKAQEELSSLGTPMDSSPVRRQAFCRWVNTYLRHMAAATQGEYELLPCTMSSDGVDLRLRAVLRQQDAAFQAQIEATKTELPHQAQGDDTSRTVGVGDYVQVEVNGKWVTAKVIEVGNSGDVKCREFPTEWIVASRWRVHPRGSFYRFIAENRGDELAIFPSYRVFCNMFRQYVDTWETPTTVLVTQYQCQTLRVSNVVMKELGASSRVENFMNDRVQETLKSLREEAEGEMLRLLEGERRPYTQDADLFQQLDQLRRKTLEEQFKEALGGDDNGNVQLSNVMKALFDSALGNDDREAMEMEFALQAYTDVAIKRFVDFIPMRLNELVLTNFLRRMETELMGTTDERLERLLQESEHTCSRREALLDEVRVFQDAKSQIEMFC